MGKNISKNARLGNGRQIFYCPECNGRIENISIFENGKLKHISRCTRCKKTGNKGWYLNI